MAQLGGGGDEIGQLLAGQIRLEEQLSALKAALPEALAAAEGRLCGEWRASLRKELQLLERRPCRLPRRGSLGHKDYSDAGPAPPGPLPSSAPDSPKSELPQWRAGLVAPKPEWVTKRGSFSSSRVSEPDDRPSPERQIGDGAEQMDPGIQQMDPDLRMDNIASARTPESEFYPWSASRSFCRTLVNSNKFEPCMGLLIILNTVSVGVEIQSSLDGDTAVQGVLDILENILLLGFLVELVIRMMANGWDCWSNLWFLTDFVLVFVGVIAAWVVKPALHISSNSVEELDLIQQLLVVRILRLIRLVRAMRLIDYFQELWKLTKGLITSGRTVISALIMVIIVIYGFACLGVEVIYNSEVLRADPATAFILETRFSSLPSTMLTLGAFANADSVASIYVPLCQVQPWLVFYFCCLWLVVTVSLMNLVTAVIVESAIAGASEDAEMDRKMMRKQLKRLVPAIQEVFMKLDTDNEGTLSREELAQADIVWPQELAKTIQTDKLVDLFEFLDIDDNNQIDRKEFVDGVCHLALSSVPIETTQILQMLRLVNTRVEAIQDSLCSECREDAGTDLSI